MRFKRKRDSKGKKKRKTFYKLESSFFSYYFFITPFLFHFKDDF